MNESCNQAFWDAYSAFKKLSDERHSCLHILELLKSMEKSSFDMAETISADDLIDFWFADILPLLLDDNFEIQSHAIDAVEHNILTLEGLIRSANLGQQFRSSIITLYAPRLHSLRDSQNHNWHKIWCVLFRLNFLHKNVETINTFLLVVENGFCNSDNIVVAESFYCWRYLIKILNTSHKLTSKWTTIICTPLKATRNTSPYIVSVKVRVWWYLITCLDYSDNNSFEDVVEPFLIYLYGTENENCAGVAHKFIVVRNLAAVCVSALLALETQTVLVRLLRDFNLEYLCVPSPLSKALIINNYENSLATAVFRAIRTLANQTTNIQETVYMLLNLLLSNITTCVLKFSSYPFSGCICTELKQILRTHPELYIFTMKTIAAKGILFSTSDNLKNYFYVLDALTQVFVESSDAVPPAIIERCVEKVFTLDASLSTKDQWRVLDIVLDVIGDSSFPTENQVLNTKLTLWIVISRNLLKCNEGLHLRAAHDYEDNLNRWILWPLNTRVYDASLKNHGNKKIFGKEFVHIWRELLHNTESTPGRKKFMSSFKDALINLLLICKDENIYTDLYETYVEASLKWSSKKDSNINRDIFSVFNTALGQLSQQNLERCLNTLSNVIARFSVLNICLNEIAATINLLDRTAKDGLIDLAGFERWKLSLLNMVDQQSRERIEQFVKFTYDTEADSPHPSSDGSNLPDLICISPAKSKKQISSHEIVRQTRLNSPLKNQSNYKLRRDSEEKKTQDTHWLRNENRETRVAENSSSTKDVSTCHCKTVGDVSKNETCQTELTSPERLKVVQEEKEDGNVLTHDADLKNRLRRESTDKQLRSNSKSGNSNKTNNSDLERKSSAHFTGRGARFVDMIRNKGHSSSTNIQTDCSRAEQILSNEQCKDSSLYPQQVPSSTASPTTSILKKKLNADGNDIITEILPVLKRKRVGFRDPLVSYTIINDWEYENTVVTPTKRCLFSDHDSVDGDLEAKQVFKRQKTIDTKSELQASEVKQPSTPSHTHVEAQELSSACTCVRAESCSKGVIVNLSCIQQSNLSKITCQLSPLLQCEIAFNLLLQHCSLGMILDKFVSIRTDLNQDFVNLFAELMSKMMHEYPKFRATVFEIATKNYPLEILDLALQRNSSSEICNRLDSDMVMEYVCTKSKVNSSYLKHLIIKICSALKSSDLKDDILFVVENILHSYKFPDETILDLMDVVLGLRSNS